MMDKFAGIKIAAFITGVVLPIIIVGTAWNVTKDVEPCETEAVNVNVPSYIDTFVVDYEQYGNMLIGERVIKCDICNNSANIEDCAIHVEDLNGNDITEEVSIRPSNRVLVLDTSWSGDTPGEYEMQLVYKVGETTIVGPFTILLNGG